MLDIYEDHNMARPRDSDRVFVFMIDFVVIPAIYNCASKAALSPILEKRSITVSDLVFFSRNVGSTFAQRLLTRVSSAPCFLQSAGVDVRHALQFVDDRKVQKHGEACAEVGVVFCPLLIEVLGG